MNYSRLALILTIFIFSGCTTVNVYKNPLTELSSSVTQTKVAIDIISSEVYKAKVRNKALDAAIESRRFGTNDLENVIPPEYLKIRLHGLQLIEELSVRLLQVIDSNAGSNAAASIEKTGTKAQALAKELNNTSVANYAGPVSNLAGTIIRIYDNNKREEILEKGIKDGIPKAKEIVELLKKDFTLKSPIDIQDALIDELKQTVTEKIGLYDEMLTYQKGLSKEEKKNPELISKRLKAIEEIIIAQDALNALNSQSVIDTLSDLEITLDQLKDLVNSNNNPANFSVFVSKLTNFSNSSVLLLEAANAVKKAGEVSSK